MLALHSGDRAQDAGVEPSLGGRQVVLARDGGHLDGVALDQVDEGFELSRLPVQSVEVPNHDRSYEPGFDVGTQPFVRRPGLAAVGADVVVGVDVEKLPASLAEHSQAVPSLAFHAKATTGPVI